MFARITQFFTSHTATNTAPATPTYSLTDLKQYEAHPVLPVDSEEIADGVRNEMVGVIDNNPTYAAHRGLRPSSARVQSTNLLYEMNLKKWRRLVDAAPSIITTTEQAATKAQVVRQFFGFTKTTFLTLIKIDEFLERSTREFITLFSDPDIPVHFLMQGYFHNWEYKDYLLANLSPQTALHTVTHKPQVALSFLETQGRGLINELKQRLEECYAVNRQTKNSFEIDPLSGRVIPKGKIWVLRASTLVSRLERDLDEILKLEQKIRNSQPEFSPQESEKLLQLIQKIVSTNIGMRRYISARVAAEQNQEDNS